MNEFDEVFKCGGVINVRDGCVIDINRGDGDLYIKVVCDRSGSEFAVSVDDLDNIYMVKDGNITPYKEPMWRSVIRGVASAEIRKFRHRESDDRLKQYFPYEEYRTHQRETVMEILQAYRDGYQNVILESPVGSGKSVIAMAVANALGSAYYLTIQKILQRQLANDFGHDGVVDVRGRNAYKCWMINDFLKVGSDVRCDKGLCVRKDKSKLKRCQGMCPYNNVIVEAMSCPISVFNFYSFLYQVNFAKRFSQQRRLLVVDECHNTDMQIMSFVETKIKGRDIGIDMPEFDNIEKYLQFFDSVDLSGILNMRAKEIENDLKAEIGNCDINDAEMVSEEAVRLANLLKSYKSMIAQYLDMRSYVKHIDSVCEYKDNVVTIKPLRSSYHAEKLLFKYGRYRLFMSATVLNYKIFSKDIGLDLDKTKFIALPNMFPVENRKIYLDYAGSMKMANKNKTIPKLVKKIDHILNKYPDDRGIIHCQSFALMDQIIDGLPKKTSKRLISQKDFKNKEELLKVHSKKKASIIIAPALHEGLDLKYDLSRVQIITKVPYYSIADNKQLQIRSKENWGFYLWLAAIKLVQSFGRSVRAHDDYADTYILDEDFDKFFNQCDAMHLLPGWFIESIIINES